MHATALAAFQVSFRHQFVAATEETDRSIQRRVALHAVHEMTAADRGSDSMSACGGIGWL